MKSYFRLKQLLLIMAILYMTIPIGIVYGEGRYIISPSKIEGLPGQTIDISEIIAQKLTSNQVTNIPIMLVDDEFKTITKFPNENYKATVVIKSNDSKNKNREIIGFIDLVVTEENFSDSIPLENLKNVSGEYLFYQEGRIFTNISSAYEGDLYFWKRPKNGQSRPLILNIGKIENGSYLPKDFIKVTSHLVKINN